jgi:hypothetical protein
VISADGTVTIIRGPASVTANNITRLYGQDNPALTAKVVGQVVGCDVVNYSLSTTASKTSEVGVYPITVTLGSNPNYSVSKTDGKLTINPAILTVTADNQSAPYGDPNPAKLGFKYSGWVNNEGPSVLTTEPTCSTTRTPLSPAGTYPITCSGGVAANYAFTYVPGTFTVSKEDAFITYTGDTQVTTAKAGTKATVTLAAVLEEEQDSSLGSQLAGQRILFQVYAFGADMNTATPTTTCTATIGNVANGKGYGSCTVSLGAGDPYQVKVSLVTNSYYSADFENAAVLVNDPGTGMTVGGGWVTDPESGKRASLAFVAKFIKNGNVQGNSLFVYRVTTDLSKLVAGAPSGERAYSWIVKSNAMSGLNIYNCPVGAKTGCRATITGKATIQAVDRLTGVTYGLGGNYQFQVDVYDSGEPSKAPALDQYAIRVWNASGVYYLLGNTYDDNGKLLAPLAIGGGNIQVKPK